MLVDQNKTLIIAEAGVNHNGDMVIAKKLIDAAAEAKVDFVKFQTFKSANLVSRHAEKAAYQKKDDAEESQLSMLQKLELTKEMHFELIAYCKLKGVAFLSTAFDLESIDFLRELGMPLFKVPSGEITNLPYLRKIAATGLPVVISTGMSTIEEIQQALAVFEGNTSITVLHCNTQYPTPLEDVNLQAMETIAKSCGVVVGYSDHTLGIQVPVAAVAMGAKVIEKHFTLDRTMKGPDHSASLEPGELKEMVRQIREMEMILGSSEKKVTDSESKNREVARKSIVANKAIKAGEVFTEDNITTKRPGTGISPMKWDEILGKVASIDYFVDDLIQEK